MQNNNPVPGGLKASIKNNENVKPNSDLLNTLKTTLPQFFEKDIVDEEGNLIEHGAFKADKFLEEIKANNIVEARDGYKLSFVGKDYARLQTGRASETVIVPDHKHNSLPENKDSGNVFITGDNIDALRHLVNAYENRIKLIYIDPPYNTGQEFVYSDNFEFNDEKLSSALGYNEAEIARLKSIQGRSSHSAWLTFMYPRLKIAQKLLTPDGLIFISIDDNEQANLRLLMDEVIGENNFVGNIAWESKTKSQNTESAYNKLQPKIEHIFVYTKHEGRRFNLITKGEKEYPLTDEKGVYREYPLEVMNATGVRGRETMIYEIEGISPPPGKQWQLGKEKITEYKNNGNLIISNNKIIIKMRPEAEKAEMTEPFWGFFSKDIGTAESAKKELNTLLGIENIFDTVKPIDLIERLILHSTSKNDIILDFFAGSATTAHAVMQLNANDGGNRKYILVQWDEPTKEDSEARKAGYKTIDQISRERIKRAGKNILKDYKEAASVGELQFIGESEQSNWDKDIGFKHYRLVTPDVKTLDKIETFDPTAPLLIAEDMITPFANAETETSGIETLLTTWIIDDGFTFDTPVETLKIAGYTAHLVRSKLYLIAPDWGAEQTKDLLNRIGKNELNVQHIVVYAYSFLMESLRELEINIKNTLDGDHQVYIERRY
ncbi:site-specific DNA-methyltransferase [Treponema sp. OttesenSCG-928-L16]|nr:site-specific DNA-methyltransferase [Treponema sp. OttesenSCG-928-L16]